MTEALIPVRCSACDALIHELRLDLPMPAEEFIAALRRVATWHECPSGPGWEPVIGRTKKTERTVS